MLTSFPALQSFLIRALDVDNAPALLQLGSSLHQVKLAAAATHVILGSIDTVKVTPEFAELEPDVQEMVRLAWKPLAAQVGTHRAVVMSRYCSRPRRPPTTQRLTNGWPRTGKDGSLRR